MSDVKLCWNSATQTADLVLENGQLVMDSTLQTAVIISWFTDRRADDDVVLPDYIGPEMPGSGDRRGYWGDHYSPDILAAIAAGLGVTPAPTDRWGSLFWTLAREKSTADVLARAKQYGADALQWMLDNGVASKIDVTASVLTGGDGSPNETLLVGCRIYKPDGTTENYAFDYAWRAIAAAAAAPVAAAASSTNKLDTFILDESPLA